MFLSLFFSFFNKQQLAVIEVDGLQQFGKSETTRHFFLTFVSSIDVVLTFFL